MIWLILGLAIVSAFLYRRGGTSAGTLWRDLGVSTIISGVLLLLGIKIGWLWLLSWGVCYGALTSYRYFLPKPVDYSWWHFALHGFMIALSTIIVAYYKPGAYIRLVALPLLLGGWYFIARKSDTIHEMGRGFFIVATLPLLLI